MTAQLRIFCVLTGVLVMMVITELVRRRKLREEYSWLWVAAGVVILLLSVSYGLMINIGKVFGGILPSTMLYLFAILFLVLVSLHYSVKISALHNQVKDLTQEIALLNEMVRKKEKSEG